MRAGELQRRHAVSSSLGDLVPAYVHALMAHNSIEQRIQLLSLHSAVFLNI